MPNLRYVFDPRLKTRPYEVVSPIGAGGMARDVASSCSGVRTGKPPL